MITIYEENVDSDLNLNETQILKQSDNKLELNLDEVIEENDPNPNIWINPIFKKNPFVTEIFLFVNNIFERNYVQSFKYALTGMFTYIVSTMVFFIKDPASIQKLQGMMKELNLSLSESQINSRLKELKVDNVFQAYANKKQQTNIESKQIKPERNTSTRKVQLDALQELCSKEMVSVVQHIASKPEMVLDIAKGMQKIGKSQSIDNSTIEIGMMINSGVNIQPVKRTSVQEPVQEPVEEVSDDTREFRRMQHKRSKSKSESELIGSSSAPEPSSFPPDNSLHWTATPTVFIGFFIKYAFFRK